MRRSREPLRGRSRCSWLVLLLPLTLASCNRSDPGSLQPADTTPAGIHSHANAAESCLICDPAKRDEGRLWCREHARYEDRCWICQPQLEKKDRPYCKEHSLYEDECFLCRPELEERSSEANGNPGSPKGAHPQHGDLQELFCREHRLMERECGICQPQLAKSLEPGASLKVRFASTQSASKAGIRTTFPRPSKSRPSFTAFCEVQYNQNRVARITPLAPGIVQRVLADVGADVEAGDTLVEIHSAEIATAKAAFVAAVVDARLKKLACKREERLVEKKISAAREFQEADAACQVAQSVAKTTRQKLLNYGLTDSEIAEVERTQDSSSLLRVRAPYAGTLVGRNAARGEAVQPGAALFTLADLSEVWLELSIPADRVAVLEKGLTVEATFAVLPGVQARGTISWVDASIDRQSRMVEARAVVSNPEGRLKAGLFGEARVLLRDVTPSMRLPKSTVQKLEGHDFVFVKLEDDLYALRRVLLGSRTGRVIDVLQGVRPDEQVVVEGTFTVMSEFLKSRLGAGCVDE